MALPSYHNHTVLCDAKNTAEEMVLAAIKAGMPEIGFSAHSRMPGDPCWCLTETAEREYFETVTALKEKYSDKIKIYLGVEQDFYGEPIAYPYDYVIGSVHALDVGGELIDVDLNPEVVRKNVEIYFGGDPYLYVEHFYETVSKVYEKTKCDIIGHLDLVTKFLDRDPLFSEEHPRYIAAREGAIATLLKAPAVFEINTGGIYRGYRKVTYPNFETVTELYNRGAKFVINADSHSIDSVDFMLDTVANELKARGIPHITSLSDLLKITRR